MFEKVEIYRINGFKDVFDEGVCLTVIKVVQLTRFKSLYVSYGSKSIRVT